MGRKEKVERLCLPTLVPLCSHQLSRKDRHRCGAKLRLTSGRCWYQVRIWMGFLPCFVVFFTCGGQHANRF